MIVTLAGHVDHGKTSLVHALTGVDTDRLEEEKRRGLTIDLGFAYLNEGVTTLGFVDVPGHHRFIHNMVAGVSQEQHALLVIAADDGPMPQSREHLQILELIGVTEGTVALTKCDRVTPEQLQAARTAIRALISNSALADAEIVETAVPTGQGIDELKSRLLGAADRPIRQPAGGEFRMPIDRAFSISGSGVVVTGTVHAGEVAEGDNLTLFPTMTDVRVKGLRIQDTATREASPGDRTAVNLSGVETDEVERGQWLTSNPTTTSEFSLNLKILDDFPRPVRHWLPVHVYHATTHTKGHIALLSGERLTPGETRLAEIVTEDPLLLRRDDRIIVRDQGLDRTLGGGRIVSAVPADGRRRSETRLKQLDADSASDPASALAEHLKIGALALDRFARNWDLTEKEVHRLVTDSNAVIKANYAISGSTWQRWLQDLLAEIADRHQADSALQGLKQSELESISTPVFTPTLLAELVADGKLQTNAGRYQPAAHKVGLSNDEQAWLDRVQPLLEQPQPPSLGDMAKQFRLGVGDLAKRLHPLVAKKVLIRISDTRYYLPAHLHQMAEVARTLDTAGPFTVRQYRDASGIGRNVAIEVLEYFDRVGFTRRDEQIRRIIGGLDL
jgi:selenocysteine-specific elongation factor